MLYRFSVKCTKEFFKMVEQLRRARTRSVYPVLDNRRVRVLPPEYKQKRYAPLVLTVIHAREREIPEDRDQIDWKLMTDLPVRSRQEAIEKLDWYSQRWKIETFHKIIKSGCRAEASKLRTADRLVNLLSIFCIISWRIFWMTMLNRDLRDLTPKMALNEDEIKILDLVIRDRPNASTKKTLSTYIDKIARLGGYLARKSDGPSGNMVIWRGLSRLTDIEFGFALGAGYVGN